MTSMRSQFVLILTMLALLCLTAHGWAQGSEVQGQARGTARPDLRDALAQVPEGQSEITYQNGVLAIKANGAPLIEVVRAVCTQIGAELDAKSEPSESVVSIVGPGPAKEVLASLLNDYKVNYAMGGTPGDPNTLASIMILPESTASSDQAKSDADTQQSQDSAAKNQEAEQQATQATEPQVAPTLSPAEVQSRVSEVQDLFVQMQSELAQAGGAANLDMKSLLKEAEAQVKAETNPPVPLSAPASVRPRGRSRHVH